MGGSSGQQAAQALATIGPMAFPTNQQGVPRRQDLVDAASGPGATHIEGYRLVGSGRSRRVLVTHEHGGNLRGLARTLRLSEDEVLHALLQRRANAFILPALFHNAFERGGRAPAWPGLERGRRLLLEESRRPFFGGSGRRIRRHPVFHNWHVPPTTERPLELPASDAFVAEVAEARLAERAEALRPELRGLRGDLDVIRFRTRVLEGMIDGHRALIEDDLQDLHALGVLDSLLRTMLAHPKDATDDEAGVRRLQEDLKALRELAVEHVLKTPPGPAGRSLRETTLQAIRLRDALNDEAFRDRVTAVTRAAPIIRGGRSLLDEVAEAEEKARQLLMLSPVADEVLEQDILPVLDHLASSEPQPMPNIALAVLINVVKLSPNAIGNVPGPASLSVALMEAAGPLILERAARAPSTAAGTRLAGRLVRGVARVGGMTASARARLEAQVADGDLIAARETVAGSFMTSRAWTASVAAINIAIFIMAVQDHEEGTLGEWASIIGSAAQTIASLRPLAETFNATRALVQHGMIDLGSQALGVVAGVCGVVAGIVAAVEEHESGDQVGMWLALAGAGGAAMTVAGFIVGGGLVVGGTGVGLPLGTLLVIIGAAVGLVAGILSLYRELTMADSHRVFEAYVVHLGRPGGTVNHVGRYHGRTALWSAYQTVHDGHASVDFWDVHPDRIPDLHQLGFRPDMIALIVDEEEAVVRGRLPG